MQGKIARAAVAAGLALALCGGVAACDPASSPGPGPQGSTTAPAADPSDVTITGSAADSSADPVAGVTIGFKAYADLGSCGTCGLHTAVTDADGTYSITLPAGIYEALCAKTGQTCDVDTNPPAATARVNADTNGSLNFLVGGSTTPPPDTQPTDPDAGGGGNVVSGYILYASGQPVAGQDITFQDEDCASCDSQPHVTTGADGSYSIALPDGIYQAQCDYIPGCGVQSNASGQGQTVNVPPGGTVDFVACEPNTGLPYPQCLQP